MSREHVWSNMVKDVIRFASPQRLDATNRQNHMAI